MAKKDKDRQYTNHNIENQKLSNTSPSKTEGDIKRMTYSVICILCL